MGKIDNKADFIKVVSFFQSLNAWGLNWDKDIEELPERLRQFIEEERAIYPKHLSIELFKELLIAELIRIEPRYKNDESAGKTIDLICQFSVRDPKFLSNENYSFEKGLLILGKVGCGKTLICKGLISLLKRFASHDKGGQLKCLDASFIPAYTMTETFAKIGYDIFTPIRVPGYLKDPNTITHERLFIDDIGSEQIVTSFGNTENVVGAVLLRRYDEKAKTFATTNLDPKSLKQFYGDRVYSRITEMMNFIIMSGGDRRQ